MIIRSVIPFIIGLLTAFNCSAELLQVSADKTTFLSTDSLDAYQSTGDHMVGGIVYVRDNKGATEFSRFVTSCDRNGGALVFSHSDGKPGKEIKWSINGKGAIDSIGITSCKYIGYIKG